MRETSGFHGTQVEKHCTRFLPSGFRQITGYKVVPSTKAQNIMKDIR